jgi:hypothetical protein
MIKKSLIALAVGIAAFSAAPASATFSWWGGSSGGSHTHFPGCGHSGTTTGGSTTTGGTAVPEPGMLAMFGLGLAAVAVGRRRSRRS